MLPGSDEIRSVCAHFTHQLRSIFDGKGKWKWNRRSELNLYLFFRASFGDASHRNWHHLPLNIQKLRRGLPWQLRERVCAESNANSNWIEDCDCEWDWEWVWNWVWTRNWAQEPAGGIISTLNSKGAVEACLKCWASAFYAIFEMCACIIIEYYYD